VASFLWRLGEVAFHVSDFTVCQADFPCISNAATMQFIGVGDGALCNYSATAVQEDQPT